MSWNEFQRANKGKGYSRADMSRLYQASRTSSSTARPSSSNSSITADLDRLISGPDEFSLGEVQQDSKARRPNAWNDFRREHAGRGLSMQELRQLYNAHKTQDVEEPPRTPPSHSRVDFAPQAPTRSDAARVANRTTAKPHSMNCAKGERLGRGQSRSQFQETSAVSRRSRSGEAAVFRESKANFEKAAKEKQATRTRKPRRPNSASQDATMKRTNTAKSMERVVATREVAPSYIPDAQPPRIERESFPDDSQLSSRTTLEDRAPDAGFAFDDGVNYINPSRIVRFMTLDKKDSTGFDTVWAGEMDGISVAVKMVCPATANNEDTLKRDVTAMMRARNAHIVQPYGYTHVELDNGSLSLAVVMEFMQGGCLQSAIRQRNWSLGQKRAALLQVLDSLTFLHNQNIAHRNLKPSTILLSSDFSVVKLADFGLSTFKNRVSAGSPAGSLWQDVDTEHVTQPSQQKAFECQVCTFINQASSANCELCSTELMSTASAPLHLAAEWECVKCTLVNYSSDEVCTACGGSKLATMESIATNQLLLSMSANSSKELGASSWYSPPEMKNPNETRMDFRKSDIYSFSVLAAELLLETNCPIPPQDTSPLRLDPVRVSGVPCPKLTELIEHGWNPDPRARPDVHQVRRQLGQVFSSLGV